MGVSPGLFGFIVSPREIQDWHPTMSSVSLSCSARMGTSAKATVPTRQIRLHSSGELHRCVAYGLLQRVTPSEG